MPEVCEVKILSHYLSTLILNKEIKQIKIKEKIINLNYPLIIKKISTKGKFLWFELIDSTQKKIYILNTFGLVGYWSVQPNKINVAEMIVKINEEIVTFYYIDILKIGNFEITIDETVLIKKIESLSPDFLQNTYSNNEFNDLFNHFLSKSKKRGEISIVKFLMNQNKVNSIGSGIGNYLVAEILYHSKISPHRLLKNLTSDDLNNLNEAIQFITKWSYLHNTSEYTNHINDYINIHYNQVKKNIFPNYHETTIVPRSPFVFEVYKKTTDKFNNKIIPDIILNNRKTYWCPNIQK